MNTIEKLAAARAAAYAAWQACPATRRDEKARLEEVLNSALRALAAAKRAAQPVEAAQPATSVADAIAAQKARTAHEMAHGWNRDMPSDSDRAYRLGQPEWAQ